MLVSQALILKLFSVALVAWASGFLLGWFFGFVKKMLRDVSHAVD